VVGNGDGLPLGLGLGIAKQCGGRGGVALGSRWRERMAMRRRGGTRACSGTVEHEHVAVGMDDCMGETCVVARRRDAGGMSAWAM